MRSVKSTENDVDCICTVRYNSQNVMNRVINSVNHFWKFCFLQTFTLVMELLLTLTRENQLNSIRKHSLEIGSLKFLFYIIIENFKV